MTPLHGAAVLALHDASFLARHDDRALTTFGLSAREVGWLRAVDPRAFTCDPARPLRVLSALAEEFAPTLLVYGVRDLNVLARFFAGPEFRDCVFARGSAASAFSDFLQRAIRGGAPPLRPHRVAGAFLPIDTAAAIVRRATLPPRGPCFQLDPRVRVLDLPGGAADAWRDAWARIGTSGGAIPALLGAAQIAFRPRWEHVEYALIDGRDGVLLSTLDPESAAALRRFVSPQREGAVPTDLLDELRADRWVVPAIDPSGSAC
jgi:hypothetical protein